MPSLISPADYRKHDPETDLDDQAIQARIDANEAEIAAHFGAADTESAFLPGGGPWLFPARPVLTVMEIGEEIGGQVTILDPTDYELIDGGRTIRRVAVGAVHARSRWGEIVRITYVPADTTQVRIGVLIDLCKMDLHYAGFTSRRMGSWSESQGSGQGRSRESERAAILRRLSSGVHIA